MLWWQMSSTLWLKKAVTSCSQEKPMLNLFFNNKGMVHHEYIPAA
jgi:hypothetical protein